MKKDHFELVADNRTLDEEIDNCLRTIVEYEQLNKELQREIENYIVTDEKARNILNRKDQMKLLLEEVNIKLEKTGDQIAHLKIS